MTDAERISYLEKNLQAYIEICESDDSLKSAMNEIHKLKSLNRILEDRNFGLMSEKTQLIKQVKSLQRKMK